jgi:hypothetical protein
MTTMTTEKQPDAYYQLARMMQKLSRADLALALKQFHQSSVDNTMDAISEVVRRGIGDGELADRITSDIRRTYVEGGHIADDRKFLARTEALLCTIIRLLHEGSLSVDLSQIDAAFRAGDGIDTSKLGHNLQVVPHQAKFSGL